MKLYSVIFMKLFRAGHLVKIRPEIWIWTGRENDSRAGGFDCFCRAFFPAFTDRETQNRLTSPDFFLASRKRETKVSERERERVTERSEVHSEGWRTWPL